MVQQPRDPVGVAVVLVLVGDDDDVEVAEKPHHGEGSQATSETAES